MRRGTMTQRLVTKRVVLHVGYACNLRCRFCYYIEDLKKGKTKNWTTDQLKRRLRFARRLGKTAVDLTGGEPSIRHDIVELIAFARSIGYTDINMITNGLALQDPAFCSQLVQAGLNDVLYSIHSPIEAEHDYLTQVKGSHRKIYQAMRNMQQLGVRGRVNSVVSNINYKHLNQLFESLLPYSPAAVNLIVFNPSETTITLPDDDGTRIEDYWVVSKEISKALDEYKSRFDTINVRFLPFCLLPGHEDVIRTQWQKMYEDQEWDPFLNIAFQKGYVAAFGAFLAGVWLYPFHTPKFGTRDAYTLFNEIISTFRMKLYYRQNKACKRCSLRKICTGLPADYVKRFNKTELKPFTLDRVIEDPLYFCQQKTACFESLRQVES
jgi:MoaA/NifB/PqqE/SkfB family radical SAM enzyme